MCVSIRQHTSTLRQHTSAHEYLTSAYVSTRVPYVSIRQHTSTCDVGGGEPGGVVKRRELVFEYELQVGSGHAGGGSEELEQQSLHQLAPVSHLLRGLVSALRFRGLVSAQRFRAGASEV